MGNEIRWIFAATQVITSKLYDSLCPISLYFEVPLHGFTLIETFRSNNMPIEVWDEIAYPLPNSNVCAVEV